MSIINNLVFIADRYQPLLLVFLLLLLHYKFIDQVV